jgi:gas vesicle protein
VSQRVNITYSVEIDQLDIEVQRLIKSALSEVQTMVNDCNSLEQANPLTIDNCQLIDNIRQRLAKADIVFNDVVNIINGYLQYQLSSANNDIQASENTHEPISEDLSVLKNKLDMFRESIKDDNVTNEIAD